MITRSHRSLSIACCALSLLGVFACSDSDEPGQGGPTIEEQEEQETADARVPAVRADASAGTRNDAASDPGDDDDGDDDDAPTVDAGLPRMDASSARRDGSTGGPAEASVGTSDAGMNSGGDDAGGGAARFSFFMTSMKALIELAKDQNGFGGDLRFGETGDGAGLRGADKICTTIAEKSMPGSGAKGWRAFLSATAGGANGGAVNAIDRVGEGPWYDRVGRLVANNKADLMQVRPASADTAIKNDLPNEEGVPNHAPEGRQVDNHHVLTGSNDRGQLYMNNPRVTCNDWTKSQPDTADAPRVGLSWPRRTGGGGGGGVSASHWLSAMDESGCGKGINIAEMGGPNPNNPTVGSGGGYGAIYCFALKP